MMLRHRRWHLRIWIALAVLLPVMLVGAVVLRQPMPQQVLPAFLEPAK
jgi:hypothetical protein